jgi:hypothetical protein
MGSLPIYGKTSMGRLPWGRAPWEFPLAERYIQEDLDARMPRVAILKPFHGTWLVCKKQFKGT